MAGKPSLLRFRARNAGQYRQMMTRACHQFPSSTGRPLLVLFLMSVRLLSLVEGRIVEALLGERMPRRPLYTNRDKPWLQWLKELFTDARTWTAMGYFLLMPPLGTAYFSVFVTLSSASLGFIVSPLSLFIPAWEAIRLGGWSVTRDAPWLLPPLAAFGVLLLFATLHLARGLGKLHGWLAKHLLVRDPVV